ncbi:hypothetical protein FGIG_12287 [Fasciola gigantica]|uniref:Uncharacterized protein n=1 Tax=Fasciola gigantica TaxID=46835 RepID=A0A504YCF7_FASGI|nr:hypothetical protein FGIG_12287 [Fasciola gigantica]
MGYAPYTALVRRHVINKFITHLTVCPFPCLQKILPVDEVLDYLITILQESQDDTPDTSVPVNVPNGPTSEPDTPAIQELALNILCCVLDGSSSSVSADPDGSRDSPVVSNALLSEAHFPGSESHLLIRSDQILPMLREFCCHGLTRACPPTPLPSGSIHPTQPNGNPISNTNRTSRSECAGFVLLR